MLKNKHLTKLTMSAMFTALAVAIGTICKLYFTLGPIRITFENFTILLTGMYLGPVYGCMVGVCTDLISCLTSAQGTVNPLITLGAGCVGLISGSMSCILHRTETKAFIPLCVFPAHIIGNMIVKSLALHYYYAAPLPVVLLRIPTYIIIGVCECILIRLILKNREIKKHLEDLR